MMVGDFQNVAYRGHLSRLVVLKTPWRDRELLTQEERRGRRSRQIVQRRPGQVLSEDVPRGKEKGSGDGGQKDKV